MENLSEEFLRGVKLFNERRFYECHEAWEAVWLKAEGAERKFLHAIIQVAVALHHFQSGNLKGARSVGFRAIGKLEAMPDVVMQLDTGKLRSSFENFLSQTDVPYPQIELQGKTP